jgi:hypothetical protein
LTLLVNSNPENLNLESISGAVGGADLDEVKELIDEKCVSRDEWKGYKDLIEKFSTEFKTKI